MVLKGLMITIMMKKTRKMRDRGSEDVNVAGGSPSAQMGMMEITALMDQEVHPTIHRALLPGDGGKLPLSGIRYRKS